MPFPETLHKGKSHNTQLLHSPVLGLAMLALVATLLPHPANVSPIAALGLFAGTHIRGRLALLVPVFTALFVDLLGNGLYQPVVMASVYAGYLASAPCGRYLIAGRRLRYALPTGIIVASLAFFLISNLGNWLAFYPPTFADLVQCYLNGLPYFWRTLAGNSIYALLIFGSYHGILKMGGPKAALRPA